MSLDRRLRQVRSLISEVHVPKKCVIPGCGSPGTSSEHVILSALGGRLSLGGVLCEPCNNRLGKTIDDPLAAALQPFTTLLNVRPDRTLRRSGGPTLRGAMTSEGESFNILGGGQPVLPKASVGVEDLAAGGRKVHIKAPSIEDAQRLLEHQLKRFKISPGQVSKAVESHSAKRVRDYPTLEIKNLSIGGPEQFRSIAKSGLALLAGKTSMVDEHPLAFQEVAAFIGAGSGQPGVLVNHDYVNRPSVPTTKTFGPFRHSITVVGEEGGFSAAFIVLYGHLRFSALLCRASPAKTALHYIVDPLTREHEYLVGFAFDPAIPANVLAHRFVQDEVLQACNGAFGQIAQRGNSARVDEIISSVVERVLVPHDGEKLTPELLDRLVEQVALDVTTYHHRLRQEDDVSDAFFRETDGAADSEVKKDEGPCE